MKIKILFFGSLTELCNNDHIYIDLVSDTTTLLENLKETYPTLNTAVFAIAVNNQLTKDNIQLHPNDIVSLLPPFSGG